MVHVGDQHVSVYGSLLDAKATSDAKRMKFYRKHVGLAPKMLKSLKARYVGIHHYQALCDEHSSTSEKKRSFTRLLRRFPRKDTTILLPKPNVRGEYTSVLLQVHPRAFVLVSHVILDFSLDSDTILENYTLLDDYRKRWANAILIGEKRVYVYKTRTMLSYPRDRFEEEKYTRLFKDDKKKILQKDRLYHYLEKGADAYLKIFKKDRRPVKVVPAKFGAETDSKGGGGGADVGNKKKRKRRDTSDDGRAIVLAGLMGLVALAIMS